jgi:poly(3-hydroxybutyrate) depolymerase
MKIHIGMLLMAGFLAAGALADVRGQSTPGSKLHPDERGRVLRRGIRPAIQVSTPAQRSTTPRLATGILRRVPQEYATIQGAINASSDGDTVLVSEGIYYENLVISKKIKLGSLYLLDRDTTHISRTVLDGSRPRHPDSASVVLFVAGADTSTLISGCTIQRGLGTRIVWLEDGSIVSVGGGILCYDGSASIVHNIIQNNVVNRFNSWGGGIDVESNSGLSNIVKSNIISHNRSEGPLYVEAAGLSFSGSGEIANNIIAYNTVTNGPGGGLSIWSDTSLRLINNTVAFNTSYGGIEGEYINSSDSVFMINNIFWNPGDGVEITVEATPLCASNNLIRGDYYGEHHFSEPPAFQDSLAFPLSAKSPAVSAGVQSKSFGESVVVSPSSDIHGTPRSQPAGSIPDLGAIESPFSVQVPFSRDPQMTNRTITSSGMSRRYIMYTPLSYSTAKHLPLLIFLNGDGGTSEVDLAFGFQDIAEREGFILVLPDSYYKTEPSWLHTDSTTIDMIFLNDLLDTLIQHCKVDPERIFLGGISQGANMTFRFVHFYGNRLRAIAPVANIIWWKPFGVVPKSLPMIYFMGTADTQVPYDGYSWCYSAEQSAAFWADLNNCPTPPLIQSLPDLVTTDGCTGTRFVYPGGDLAFAPVVFYKIVGGEHNLPGPQIWWHTPVNRDINGPELIWRFCDMVSKVVGRAPHLAGTGRGSVRIMITDPSLTTGHRYRVTIDQISQDQKAYSVRDLTTGGTLKVDHALQMDGVTPGPEFDGLKLIVSDIQSGPLTAADMWEFHDIGTDVSESVAIPEKMALFQNYPNPFNPKTVVSCQWPVASRVRLVVYDFLGREVKVLMDERKEPGRYEVTWDASGCASGVYICRMTAGQYIQSRTMVLLK